MERFTGRFNLAPLLLVVGAKYMTGRTRAVSFSFFFSLIWYEVAVSWLWLLVQPLRILFSNNYKPCCVVNIMRRLAIIHFDS